MRFFGRACGLRKNWAKFDGSIGLGESLGSWIFIILDGGYFVEYREGTRGPILWVWAFALFTMEWFGYSVSRLRFQAMHFLFFFFSFLSRNFWLFFQEQCTSALFTGLTILFTHLKIIILLPYFQFSIKISCI